LYKTENDILFFMPDARVCIPDSPALKSKILQEAHDSILSGHFGVEKTYSRLTDQFFWPNMKKSVQHYVDSCHTCKTVKSRRAKENGLLQPLRVLTKPWSDIAMDLITPRHAPRMMLSPSLLSASVKLLSLFLVRQTAPPQT